MIVERLASLYLYNNETWTSRPTPRQIFMFAVSMLELTCDRLEVEKLQSLAVVFDERHLLSSDLLAWTQEPTEIAEVLDSAFLIHWLQTSNLHPEIDDLGWIPSQLLQLHKNRYRRMLAAATAIEVISGNSDARKDFELGEFQYELRVGSLFDCAFGGVHSGDVIPSLNSTTDRDALNAVVSMSEAVVEDHRWSDLPILADALDDIGASAAASHLRTKDHCRACWPIYTIYNWKHPR